MYVAKICLNSVQVGPNNFILGGWHYDDPPPLQVGHKTVAIAICHGNTGCLATGPQNLQFMIKYIKNAKTYKLQNRQISSRCGPGHMTQFLWKKVKDLGHTGILCIKVKCAITPLRVVTWTSFLEANMRMTPQRVRCKMVAIATTVA